MQRTAQITLTADTAKRLIAWAVYHSELFQTAKSSNRILFKGSTTVSALSQLATGEGMRICGRMEQDGMRGHKTDSEGPHWLLLENGQARRVDDEVGELVKTLGPGDLFITGANAIDAEGNAAMLLGAPGGGGYGEVLTACYTEGFKTLILATTDKMIPGDLRDIYPNVSRKACDYARGMACSLAPVPGTLVTELQAIWLLAEVDACVFARGGVNLANGASAIQIRGEEAEVEKVLTALDAVLAQQDPLGTEVSLAPCTFPSTGCGYHLSCCYAKKNTMHR